MTSVPPSPIWSHTFLFLTVFKVIVISVTFRVVAILGTETLIIVTEIVSSSLSCGSSAMKTFEDVPKRCCIGPLRIRGLRFCLRRPLSFVHLHPGDWPRCVSKSELLQKKSLPMAKLPGALHKQHSVVGRG